MKPPVRRCEQCDKPLKKRQQRYCSRKCVSRAVWGPEQFKTCQNATCPRPDRKFKPKSHRDKFCSVACVGIAKRINPEAPIRQWRYKLPCPVCGVEMITKPSAKQCRRCFGLTCRKPRAPCLRCSTPIRTTQKKFCRELCRARGPAQVGERRFLLWRTIRASGYGLTKAEINQEMPGFYDDGGTGEVRFFRDVKAIQGVINVGGIYIRPEWKERAYREL